MLRNMTLFAAVLLVLAAGGELAAQDAWPAYTVPFARGPGFYAAIWKLVLLVVVVWAWVKSADWVSRDTAELGDAIGLPASIWNPVVALPFFLAFLLAVTIPVFFAGWAVALLAYVVPFAIYVVQRNARVTDDKKVFTPSHIHNVLSNLGKKQPKRREVKHTWQLGPEVDFHAVGPLQVENQQALIEARNSPAYDVTIVPAYLPDGEEQEMAVYRRLSELLDMPISSRTASLPLQTAARRGIQDIVDEARDLAPYRPVTIRNNVPRDVALQIARVSSPRPNGFGGRRQGESPCRVARSHRRSPSSRRPRQAVAGRRFRRPSPDTGSTP
jgi:hypothetical protein